jgi:hypothetical protein
LDPKIAASRKRISVRSKHKNGTWCTAIAFIATNPFDWSCSSYPGCLLRRSILHQSQWTTLQIINNDRTTAIDSDLAHHSVVVNNKIAAIIENRPLDKIVPLLLHFSAVLEKEWPIILLTTQTTVPASAPLQRLIVDNAFEVRSLPSEIRQR